MGHDIATRLREVREAHGLSQRALSRSAGISNATISLIESRKLNPSVAVLKRILEGIPIHLSAFFAEEDTEPTMPVVYRSSDLVEIAGGKVSFRQVGNRVTDRNIQILTDARNRGLALTEPVSLLPTTRYFSAALKAAMEPLRMQWRAGQNGLNLTASQVPGGIK